MAGDFLSGPDIKKNSMASHRGVSCSVKRYMSIDVAQNYLHQWEKREMEDKLNPQSLQIR